MDMLAAIAIGVLSGLVASVLFWGVFFKGLRPKLHLCPNVARFAREDGPIRSQIKLRNEGRRTAIQISVVVRARVPNLIRQGSAERMTLHEWMLPKLDARREARYTIRPEYMPELERQRYMRRFPALVAAAIEERRDVDLQEFLSVRPGAVLEVHVFSTDVFSGARSFITQEYVLEDVHAGRFQEGSCDVQEAVDSG